MKKLQKFALLGAVALAGSVSFSSCSSDEDSNVGPDGQRLSVKTQFTINVPRAASTRMTAEEAGAGDFQGMDEIMLIPFDEYANNTVSGTANAENIEIKLGKTDLDLINSSAHLYNDVEVNIGTSGFLFYANSATSTNGKLTAAYGTTTNGISFALNAISDDTEIGSQGEAIATYLTSIATAMNGWASSESEGLKAIYDNFTKEGARGGSSASTFATVKALYKAIKNRTDDVAKAVKKAIAEKATVSDDGEVTALDSSLQNYPAKAYPDGAAVLTVKDGTFSVAADETTYGGLMVADATRFAYPTNLWFRANTAIRTATQKISEYTTATDWASLLAAYGTTSTSVTPATQSIALEDQIQYAVGRLDLYAKVASTDELPVNEKEDEEDKVVVPQDLQISAVLIGGQKNVDFEFLPSGNKAMTVYDPNMTQTVNLTTSYQDDENPLNYTLALETAEDEIEYIAIELTNTCVDEEGEEVDFVGANGMIIPAGAKFYLVGKLDPTSVTDAEINQVFKQDYNTIVKLNITSLKNAYNVIPDLRSSELELGLSVNLEWEPGLTFEIDLD